MLGNTRTRSGYNV